MRLQQQNPRILYKIYSYFALNIRTIENKLLIILYQNQGIIFYIFTLYTLKSKHFDYFNINLRNSDVVDCQHQQQNQYFYNLLKQSQKIQMQRNRPGQHRNYRSAQKVFEIDPQLIRRINQLDYKNNDTQLKQQYKTHKKQQKQILLALDTVKHEYLNRQRKVLVAAQKAIKEIRKVQNYIQEHLDITKEQQLDQIEPEVQKFLLQSKSLKKLLTQNNATNPQLLSTDFHKIVRQINYLKDKLELFDPIIQKFCQDIKKFQNNIHKCTKNNKNKQKSSKQNGKDMQCQTILDYSNIVSKRLEEESDFEKMFITNLENKSNKQKKNITEINKYQFLSQNQITPTNVQIDRKNSQQVNMLKKKGNFKKQQTKNQKLLNNVKEYRHIESITSIQKNPESPKNVSIAKNSLQQQKCHQQALAKIQSIFCNNQTKEIPLNSELSIPQQHSPTNQLLNEQFEPTRQISNLSMRQLQSIKSQESLFSKKSLTSQRSGSRNKNCLQVLRKQKMKYDELKSMLSI